MSLIKEYPAGVSVIICCYNSSQRLPEALRHLANQKFSRHRDLVWEIIVVDNASTDNTSYVADSEWKKYNLSVPLRIVHQPIPGNGHAKEMGIEYANYSLLLFCDDDNWLIPEYLDLAYDIMSHNKDISVLGGCGIAVCEAEPPRWFESLKAAYAVGGQGPNPHGAVALERGFIYAAGSIFRKSVMDNLDRRGFQKLLAGRTGKSLMGGEDVELCYAVILIGGEIHYDERLKFEHLMPMGRINWSYFKRLNQSFGAAFPFLMPYKLLILKQFNRFNRGISWLYLSAVYLLFKDVLLRLPTALFQGNYHRARADFANHLGFLTSLIQNHRIVKRIYKDLPQQDWISSEFKPHLI